ncbi:MAG: ribonuclease HII [Nitrospinae bacterium CG11_big_fil_rev_8_21_14_0_20_56_8]|nr:MAG: ribonuclease HII [Nitrospinae bacterium CG11_big_fil_rev_8_21_14_0_20_56_8]
MLQFEERARHRGFRHIAGIDEAGRGPLAGPVVAAAVILPEGAILPGVDDSKKLSARQRDSCFEAIHQSAAAFGIGIVDVDVIDSINILQAARLAMRRAVGQLPQAPDLLLIDGNQRIEFPGEQWTIVKGDQLSLSVAAASILAKVTRDRLMDGYHQRYPQYGFDRHKGYGTRLHRDRIRDHGPCPIHRRTFRGVREFIGNPAGNVSG